MRSTNSGASESSFILQFLNVTNLSPSRDRLHSIRRCAVNAEKFQTRGHTQDELRNFLQTHDSLAMGKKGKSNDSIYMRYVAMVPRGLVCLVNSRRIFFACQSSWLSRTSCWSLTQEFRAFFEGNFKGISRSFRLGNMRIKQRKMLAARDPMDDVEQSIFRRFSLQSLAGSAFLASKDL